MKIMDQEFHIRQITDVQKGKIPISQSSCESRRCDAFVYITSGSAAYDFGGRSVAVEKGDVLFLAYRSGYHISVTVPDYHFIFVDFFFEESATVALENQVFRSPQIASLEASFLKVHTLWFSGNFADKIFCKSLLYRVYSEVVGAALHNYLPTARRDRVHIALQSLLEGFSDPTFSVENLSRLCGFSPVHFRRIFYQVYHTTPVKFLISLRINKARELLTTTQAPVAAIAQACGFHTAYYFSKKFREHTGMTPSEYRRCARSH